ncbi:DUF6289 family protein [Nonomuraea muscovyensis]|uniref:DUF6289 family protein n=1 Tax=Nonomuraea muscovyensis TaxID=1124761 RepID=UPI0033F70A3D
MLRRTLLATTLSAALTLATVTVASAPAQARACKIDHFCDTIYYSDSAHTTAVGGKREDCDGTVQTWGRRTGYLTFTEVPC